METELICAVSDITAGPFNFIDLIYIIILLLLLFSSAAISGSEVAYFSLTPGQLEELRQKGYEKVCNLYKKPEKLLATILISNNFVNVGIVILSSYLVDSLFDFSANPLLGFFIQVVVVTFVILLFGEIIPKLYANRSAMSMAIFMAAPLTFLGVVFRPLSALLIGSTSLISKKIAKKNSISIDQLSKALELTKDSDINEEKEILEGIVRFSNIYAIDIIQPRINVIAIDQEDHFDHIREVIIEHGYSRMPVYEENLDNIVGILYIKDLLAHLGETEDFKWQSLIRPAYFVPETKKINDLLEEFQSKKVHLAIVVDEYGGTSGIVTMEDILEEIVGEINDETDEQERTYIKIKNNAFIFEGHTLLNDFEKITGLEDDSFEEIEGEADTLAGLILEIKGELPKKNDIITYKEHKFTILDVDNRRIKKIKYENTAQASTQKTK
ncbi:gliding motility-associated protein GldE [uncultured Odoribacter sp.]|uniref:gliding motility-associated protein GldE n=1 Tax=uncultured Odoribacter sp. TaxID=876416 RepID=UPI002622772C|nr:gliding motility-associated protein GldE [uncultured Odoribacter sp.]